MNAFPKVNILLSTFNGMDFLGEQLNSLQAQDYPNIFIYIRDDGSTDGTVAFLQTYQKQFSNVDLILGENIGYKRSFFELTLIAGTNKEEFYAFCDQDDIWSPQKISRAVNFLQKSSDPHLGLYFSRLTFVDSNLRSLGLSPNPRYLDFGNALVECNPCGCTMVFGSKIRDLYVQGKPYDKFSHDGWVNLVATAFGHIVYDAEPQIQFREHPANTSIGHKLKTDPVFRLKFRVKDLLQRLFQNNPIVDFLIQAEAFLKTYPDMPTNQRLLIEELFHLRKPNTQRQRLSYIFNSKVHFNDPLEDLVLKLMIVLGQH